MSALLLTLGLPLACFIAISGLRMLASLDALELGASTAGVGVLLALFALFPTLLSVTAGRLADRHGFRLPLLAGSGGMTIGLALPFALPGLPVLYLSVALFGLSWVFFVVAMQTLVNSVGGATARPRNVANFSMSVSIGQLVGPLVTGVAIDQFGFRVTFALLALLPLVPFAAVLLRPGLLPARGPVTEQPGGGSLALLRDTRLRPAIVSGALVVAAVDLFAVFMPILGHGLGLSATVIGVILGSFALATFVVRFAMPALMRRLGSRTLMTATLLCSALVLAAVPLSARPEVLIALGFLLGLCLGCGQPLSLMMVYNRAPPGRAAEAVGVRFTIVNLTHMAIPLVFGTLGAATGVMAAFWATAALLAGGGIASRREPGAGAARGTPPGDAGR
jgi:MFS family permease